MASPEINERGEVSLEGHLIGTIEGFRFTLAPSEGETDAKGLRIAQGQREKALGLHREEAALCRQLYDRNGLQKCLGNQARLLQDQEDYDGALALQKERVVICREDGYYEDLARALVQQAWLLGVRLGAAEYARELAEEALRWAQETTAGPLAAEIRELLAHLCDRV